ncbi:hypothetical protein [Micromonospora sp. WMMD812]|uniref:hypothetical protein n=1 Tax=Micromonospora sp. WMMD812 TaxID=3015152 RepID=UPI00248C73E9|nr:hypothetical protein [Micromonospora sp. WMMD812]WBB69872.1 hypothetical protein O7603_11165 [Micromonospora sp. WMMD812]
MSSLGNLLLSLTVARLATIDDLGRFALAFSLYVLATGLSRTVVTEAVLAEAVVEGTRRRAVAAGSRRVVAVGVGCALPLLAGGIVDRSSYLLLGGVALPGLLLHDYARSVGVGVGRPRRPCVREVIWTTLTALAALLGLTGVVGPSAVFGLWAGAGALLGYVTALLSGHQIWPGWRMDRPGSHAALSYGLQFLLTAGSAQLALTALGVTVGMAVVGALSAGRTVLGPATLLVGSATSLVIPYLARVRTATAPARRRAAARVTVALLLATAPACLFVLLLPDRLGEAVLGDNWRHAEPLLWLLALEVLLGGTAMVAFAGHRVHGAARRALLLGGALGVLRVPVVVACAVVWGAVGAAVALALMGLISAAAWWASYLQTTGGGHDGGAPVVGGRPTGTPTAASGAEGGESRLSASRVSGGR